MMVTVKSVPLKCREKASPAGPAPMMMMSLCVVFMIGLMMDEWIIGGWQVRFLRRFLASLLNRQKLVPCVLPKSRQSVCLICL